MDIAQNRRRDARLRARGGHRARGDGEARREPAAVERSAADDEQGAGALDATYDTATRTLRWHATYRDLTGPATAAHFHGPAPVGQNAGVQVPIPKDALASPIVGEKALTDEQVGDLMAGKWYFNVHTKAHPAGEIRGQVLPAN